MTRRHIIEMGYRQIYGGFPTDDAEVDYDLLNAWLNPAIAVAAKTNYTDNAKMDGVAYVSGSFYTTFKGLTISADEDGVFKITLPHLPYGLGADEGINTAQIKDEEANISRPIIWLTQAQKAYAQQMRKIPNKVYGYSEGEYVYVFSTLLLDRYTANVTMVSGGDSDNLDSTCNVPSDYLPVVYEYFKQQLGF